MKEKRGWYKKLFTAPKLTTVALLLTICIPIFGYNKLYTLAQISFVAAFVIGIAAFGVAIRSSSKEKDKKRKAVKILGTLSIPVLGLLVFVGSASTIPNNNNNVSNNTVTATEQKQVTPPDPDEILKLVNDERAKVGSPALVVDENLVKSATEKAQDMDTYDYYGHENHDGTRGYDYAIAVTGGESNNYCQSVSENYQASSSSISSSQNTFDWWMNSTSHREALEDAKYSRTGIAVVYDKSRDAYITVEHFCETVPQN